MRSLWQRFYKRVDFMGEKNNKRELILTAARDVFFEKGFHNATSEEIAKQAGVAKGTLYQYFSSKQEIFFEMHQQYLQQYNEKMQSCIDLQRSFTENMTQIVHFHVRHIQPMMQYALRIIPDLLAVDVGQQSCDVMKSAKSQMEATLEQLVTLGQQRGELKADANKHLLLYSITGACLGLGHVIATGQYSEAEQEKLANELLENILYGIVQ